MQPIIGSYSDEREKLIMNNISKTLDYLTFRKLKKSFALLIAIIFIISTLSLLGTAIIQVEAATTISYTFGNTSIGTLTNNFAIDRDASRFQLTQNGVLQSITVYFKNAGFNVKAAIYTDNNGVPSTLVAQSNIQAITASGWQTFAVPQTSLTAGYYWLCVVSSSYSSTGVAMMTGSTNTHVWKTATYSGDYPSTFGSPAGYDNTVTSIYATYTATSVTPTPTLVPTVTPKPTSVPSVTPTPTLTPTLTPTPTPTPGPTPTVASSPTFSVLHVSGTRLVDGNGNAVILKGVVYSSSQWWSSTASYCTEQQFIYMRNMGSNCVSISIQDYTFDDHTGTKTGCYNEPAFWTKLDQIMAWTNSHGLYVNLRFWATAGNCRHGIPSNHLDHYMSVDWSWSDWLNIADVISDRYKNYNHIIYEPLSESLYCSYSNYQTHIRDCIDAIRANCPNAIVNVQAESKADWPCTFDFEKSNPISRSNLIFSSDPYGFFTYPDNNPSAIRTNLNYLGCSWLASNGRCVFFAEFGLNGDSTYDAYDAAWLNNFMAVCDADGYSGYTAFRWCLEDADLNNILTNWSGGLSAYGSNLKTYYLSH
jgi:hypothetical protein